MFKKGDVLICLKPCSTLTLGKTYLVEGSRERYGLCPVCSGECKQVRVTNDQGYCVHLCPSRFRLSQEEVNVPGVGKIILKPRAKDV